MTADGAKVLHSDPNPRPPLTPKGKGNPVCECSETAQQLLNVLGEEKEILRRFSSRELLELLPRKQFLVNELALKLHSMGLAREQNRIPLTSDPEVRTLRESLAEIRRLNHANHVFVQCSLEYWGDFFSLFCPSTYGRCQEGNPRRMHPAPKGFTFHKEI